MPTPIRPSLVLALTASLLAPTVAFAQSDAADKATARQLAAAFRQQRVEAPR